MQENPGNGEEHTPMQRRILKEIRELIKKEEIDQKLQNQERNSLTNNS